MAVFQRLGQALHQLHYLGGVKRLPIVPSHADKKRLCQRHVDTERKVLIFRVPPQSSDPTRLLFLPKWIVVLEH